MRVNPNSSADILSYLQASQTQEQTAIEELASGLRVNVPSDDPSAAAANVLNISTSSANDQYVQNIEGLQAMMNTADSTLSSVVTELTQAISLGVEGGDGTLSDSDRQSVAQEVSGVKDQVFSLANTSFQGSYLFAGTATATQPFVQDANSASGVTYAGNGESNQVQIGAGQQTATSVPGSTLFTTAGADVFGSLQDLVNALQDGDMSGISSATQSVRSALDQVDNSRVFYGNALNGMQAQENFLNQEQVTLQQSQNQLVGMDPTKAASNLSQADLARQATLEAVAKVQSLNLLNYLQ